MLENSESPTCLTVMPPSARALLLNQTTRAPEPSSPGGCWVQPTPEHKTPVSQPLWEGQEPNFVRVKNHMGFTGTNSTISRFFVIFASLTQLSSEHTLPCSFIL